MAFRYNKRIKLGKGLGINLSKSGITTSYRTKKGSISSKGVSVKTGIPGLSYRKRFKNSGCFVILLFLIAITLFSCSTEADTDIDRDCSCSDFSTQAAAQAALNNGCNDLDRDNDGIACENLSS